MIVWIIISSFSVHTPPPFSSVTLGPTWTKETCVFFLGGSTSTPRVGTLVWKRRKQFRGERPSVVRRLRFSKGHSCLRFCSATLSVLCGRARWTLMHRLLLLHRIYISRYALSDHPRSHCQSAAVLLPVTVPTSSHHSRECGSAWSVFEGRRMTQPGRTDFIPPKWGFACRV